MLTKSKKEYIIDMLNVCRRLGGDAEMLDKAIGYLTEVSKAKPSPNKTIVHNPIPTLDEMIKYCDLNGYVPQCAVDAHRYYSASHNPTTGQKDGYWYDGRAQKVINWKLKMQSVWFKDKYKKIAPGNNNGGVKLVK